MRSVDNWKTTDARQTSAVSGVPKSSSRVPEKLSPKPIAQLVGSSVQTVRNVIQAFDTRGVAGLAKQSTRPKIVEPVLDAAHG